MKKQYDVLVIGPVSLDHNIDYLGNERKELGGAVVASGFAAARSGNATALFTKLNPADADVEARFAGSGADLYWKPSKATCSIRNQYFTADKEKRACTSMGVCDPFRFDELPDVDTKIYHFAGLVYGDFDGELFAEAAKRGKVAVDVQCLLRHVEPDKTMAFHDWAEKKQYLPCIDYLKTDAAEAEILTGLTDRAEAAKLLYSWGAKEVLITHNTDQAVLTLMQLDSVVEHDYLPVGPDTELGEIVRKISRTRYSVIPVLDAAGSLLGGIDIRKIRNIVFRIELYHHFTAQQLMQEPLATLRDDLPMTEVMNTFDTTRADWLPVLNGEGHLRGYISRQRMFTHYRKMVADMSED